MGKIIVVGSGFSGSVLAREIAEKLDRKVLVAEKRGHIGGNMYDETDDHGILIQKYGPHFLNTNQYRVIRYLRQYAEMFPFAVRLMSVIDGRYIRLPFNFESVQQLMGPEKAESLLAKLRKEFAGRDRVPVLELAEHADPDVRACGSLIFEKAYRPYLSKQWGLPPEKLDRYTLGRSPMVMGYDNRYLNKDFQYLPVEGFTKLFENMLSHPNITVMPDTDALEHLEFRNGGICYDGEKADCLVWTGAIDELFGMRYGPLPYRSLDIRYEHLDIPDALPAPIVTYPQAEGYTRKTEYRKLMYDDSGASGTVLATEYPLAYVPGAGVGNTPYYPVVTEESASLYERYKKEALKYEGLFLCGRLAEFKYYNMNVCIEHALEYFEDVKKYLIGNIEKR